MLKKWQISPPISQELLTKFPEVPPLILQLMANRGLDTQEAVDEFLNPDYSQDIHDPFLFKSMTLVVARIFQAIDQQEKIVIYGDYDADGITSTVILSDILRALGAMVDIYIPHREKEGYGLNNEAIKGLANQGTKLIITVDCGITNVKQITFANQQGIEVIVTDHHQPLTELPSALAIINAWVVEENYPFKELAGVGVAFKLAQALIKFDQENKKQLPIGFEKWLLDLVAIGTIADIVPLLGENRTLVKYGLVVLNKTRRLGLQILLEQIGCSGQLDTFNVAFQIAPRLNAAGRLNHANIVYKLLTTDDRQEAVRLVSELDRTNQERQKLTDKIIKEAKEQIDKENKIDKILFAIGEDWPLGVVGLVAGKLTEEYYRPVLVMTKLGGQIRGSGRSIKQFNIIKAMEQLSEYYDHYGGHAQACGFTLKSEIDQKIWRKDLLSLADQQLSVEDLQPILLIDAQVVLSDINWLVSDNLEKFAPFGYGNTNPRLLIKNLIVLECQLIGKDKKHLRLLVNQNGQNTKKAIGFYFNGWGDKINIGDKIDLVFEIIINEWNGNRELELKIVDLKIAKKDND